VFAKEKALDFDKIRSVISFFSAFTFVLILAINFLDSQPFISRWFPILYILVISTYVILGQRKDSHSKIQLVFFQLGEIFKYLLPFLLIYSASLPGVTGKIVRNRTGLFFTFLIVCLVIYSFRVKNGQRFKFSDLSRIFLVSFPAAIVASSMLTTRTSEIALGTIKNSPFVSFPIFVAAFLLTLHVLRFEYLKEVVTRQRIIFFNLSLFIFILWLSFRIDSMNNIPGSYFHVGYYSEVVKTLKSGGTLLWDTPSQYGFLNILILSIFPFENSRQSVYVGQAMIILLTTCSVIYLFYRLMNHTMFFLISSTFFLLIFFFADPELIGPQPYPSSSAMRFGPSILYLVILLLNLLGNRTQKFSYRRLYFSISFGLFIGALWSAEALLYSLSITGFMFLVLIVIWMGEKGFSFSVFLSSILKFFILVIASLFGAWISASIYTLFRVGHFPDLQMYVMFAMNYSKGFGSVPLQIASPAWIFGLIILFILFIYLKYRAIDNNFSVTLSLAALIGSLTGWLTYYLGRAVPDNFIAEYPLIVFCLLLIIRITYNLSDANKDTTDLKLFSWAIAGTFIGIILSSMISQPRFIGTVLSQDSLNKPVQLSTVKANSNMIEVLSEVPFSSRESIVFEGWAGVLPVLPENLKSKVNTNKAWIPSPLGLLEDPISPEIRDRIINRFLENSLSNGYLISANKDSFPERHTQLLTILDRNYDCRVVKSNEEYTLNFCRTRY